MSICVFARVRRLFSVCTVALAVVGYSGAASAQPPVRTVEIVSLPLPVEIESLPLPVEISSLPVPVKDVDARGRVPYSASMGYSQFGCFTIQCTNFVKSGGAILFDGPAVPAGKRLVIEYVSGRLPNNDGINLSVALQTEQVLSQFSVIWSYHGPFFDQSATYGFSSDAFATYGPGEMPHIHLIVPNVNNFVGLVNISGYLIDAE